MEEDKPCRLMVHVVLLPRSRSTTLVGAAAMLPLEYMAGLELTGGSLARRSFYKLASLPYSILSSLSLSLSFGTCVCVLFDDVRANNTNPFRSYASFFSLSPLSLSLSFFMMHLLFISPAPV